MSRFVLLSISSESVPGTLGLVEVAFDVEPDDSSFILVLYKEEGGSSLKKS